MTDSIDHDPFDAYAYQPTRRERAVMAAYGLAGAIRSTIRHVRRALFTMRPTYVPLAVAVLVVTPTAAAMATWATLPGVGGGMRMRGEMRVEAASEVPSAALALGDPRLQPGFTDPMDEPPPAAELHAAPGGELLPAWLPPTVARWESYIRAGAAPYGVDPALVAIVMTIESAGNPKARSGAGARSLMQVMPATAAGIDRERGRPHDPSMINDPAANIDYGAYNLAWCLRTYGVADDPDWRKSIGRACRCYNGGPSAVDNPVAESVAHDRWVVGMWSERHDATSPTFDGWREAGGQKALDISATVEGPALPQLEAMR